MEKFLPPPHDSQADLVFDQNPSNKDQAYF